MCNVVINYPGRLSKLSQNMNSYGNQLIFMAKFCRLLMVDSGIDYKIAKLSTTIILGLKELWTSDVKAQILGEYIADECVQVQHRCIQGESAHMT